MRPRRAPASSSPRSCRASAPTSRRSSRSPAHDKPALSADEKQLCVEGLKHGERYTITLARRPAVGRCTRRCRSPPTSTSMCATASRSCASPARPMCCRAPASAAFRWSASTPTRCTVEDLPHRRPQPARHRASAATSSATSTATSSSRLHRRARRAGLEGRAEGRAAAQRRRHHRFPGRARRSAICSPASM